MKVYKTGGWKELIEEVEVTNVTEKSVWIGKKRHSKRSLYSMYWDNLEEAKEYLINKYNKIIKTSELNIEKAKDNLKLLSKY